MVEGMEEGGILSDMQVRQHLNSLLPVCETVDFGAVTAAEEVRTC